MTGAFEYWLSQSAGSLELTKAVDDVTGEILGFVCWGMRLDKAGPNTDTKQTKPQDAASVEEANEASDASVEKSGIAISADKVTPQDPSLDPLEQLEEITSSHLAAFQERVMPKGTRALYVITITVHPKYQGRGVGQALIKQGTDRADAEGVFCWVHSSEAGVHAYQKCGFEEEDTLEIDLDDWAKQLEIEPPAGDDKWGIYKFRYLIRQPKVT